MEGVDLHPLKGQVATLERPPGTESLPHGSAAGGYVVWRDGEAIVGTTYEHDFEHDDPDEGIGRALRAQTAETVPGLADARIASVASGIRVTVPGTRLPCVGPVPGHERIWTHTGLGAKGLLMGPFVATRLGVWLQHPDRIPADFPPRERTETVVA